MKLYDIVEWSPSGSDANDIICYKHEAEDFNTHTQLIVHQSQEAIFFKDGRALDSFGPGKHTLKTDNIPILKKIINIPTDGKTPFHCEVFYVNKVFQADIKWGAPSMQTKDPVEDIIISVGASGTCGARIADARKFLTKFVGTKGVYTRDDLRTFLRSSIIMEVKDALAQIMNKRRISFLEATTEVKSFSVEVMAMLNQKYSEFGIEIFKFDWETLCVPDEDLKMIKDAKNRAAARRAEGYTYNDEKSFDVLKTAAGNQGIAGSVMGFGMGAGLGMPFGMGMANMAQNVMGQTFAQPQQMQQQYPQQQMQTQPQAQQPQAGANACAKCGTSLVAGARFCPSCGAQVVAPAKRFCIGCGNEITGEMRFCPICGHKTEG